MAAAFTFVIVVVPTFIIPFDHLSNYSAFEVWNLQKDFTKRHPLTTVIMHHSTFNSGLSFLTSFA